MLYLQSFFESLPAVMIFLSSVLRSWFSSPFFAASRIIKKHGTDTDTVFDGAREKIRTSTEVNPHGPEPCASASSATRAHLSLSASAD